MTATDPKPAGGLPRDLLPRLVSGIVLAAAALALTWGGVLPFAVLVLAISLIVAWEWGCVVRKGGIDTIFVVHAVAVVFAVGLTLAGLTILGLLAIVVGAILAALLGFEQLGRISALGVLYAGLPAIALVWFRAAPQFGLEAALFLLLCVWAADTGAYFAGRSIGGPKLMPRISPNKTWSGLCGAIAAAMLVGLVFGMWLPALPTGRLVVTGAALAVISQIGDLMESALKRLHDVKDASGLIPGHGGFMDRVDGLIFAAVAAAVLAAIVNVHAPARVLLTWN